METTRVFTSGRSQAVRIPKAFRFTENEVYINKIGEAIVLTPKKYLAEAFRQGIAMLEDDFMNEKLPESISVAREEL
ncbi:MAG: AbrB/MazE/SpoVT family DNA-binding domain-containing protein [Erysipelotrichaceae bacterium]|nr:AbrB/MazE/SpoVT family DNA-binding domain-containing protein [Erysipelotrichaceae bacterium]